MNPARLAPRIAHLSSQEFTPLPRAVFAEHSGVDGFTSGASALRPIAPPRFMPATGLPYERTFHALRMRGDDGRHYQVALSLSRHGEERGLRAAVVDVETGKRVAAKFAQAHKSRFAREVGAMDAMNSRGHFAFTAADGALAFDLTATLAPSTLVQGMSDKLEAALEKQLGELPEAQRAAAKKALQPELMVTDYPLTTHAGSLTVKVDGKALKLSAHGTPSSISHSYGQKPSECVVLASVPKPGAARLIAVVAKAGPEAKLGYVIRTDAAGRSKVALLTPEGLKVGGPFGGALEVTRKSDDQTAFASAALKDLRVQHALGLSDDETFEDVVVDVAGR